MRSLSSYLTDRYSERKESAEKLEKRVTLASIQGSPSGRQPMAVHFSTRGRSDLFLGITLLRVPSDRRADRARDGLHANLALWGGECRIAACCGRLFPDRPRGRPRSRAAHHDRRLSASRIAPHCLVSSKRSCRSLRDCWAPRRLGARRRCCSLVISAILRFGHGRDPDRSGCSGLRLLVGSLSF